MAGMSNRSDSPGSVIDDIFNYDISGESKFSESKFSEDFAKQSKTSMDSIRQSYNGATREGANNELPDLKVSPGKAKRDRRASLAQESATETMFRLSNHFMPLIEEGADTLVYLGIPPKLPNQSQYEFNFIEQQFQRPYLMRSETLKKVGPSKFNDFLGPVSARVERRLKKLGVHKLVQRLENIKYYIDLSPAIDGDEALTQVAQLTVPSGALNWHLNAKDFGVHVESVCGRDSLDIPPQPIYNLRKAMEPSSDDEEADQAKKANPTDDSVAAKTIRGATMKLEEIEPSLYALPVEDEHSSLRHCTTTARLLHAIAGNDPKLNSAAKAWAFCMLANFYGCAQAPQVSTHVTSWLLQSGNINFIQVNPDVAYRMAIATESIWLMRCTFAILVGQQAMIDATNDFYSGSQPNVRKVKHVATCLDDDDINRIDHAASNLGRRVRAVLEEIATFPGVWSFGAGDCFEMGKLESLRFDDEKRQTALTKVRDSFKHYTRRIIYMTMSDSFPNDNTNVNSYVPSRQFPTYKEIPRTMRLLTQHFWDILRKEEYSRDYLDTNNNHLIWETTQDHLRREGILREPSIPYISKSQVLEAVEELNCYKWSQVDPNRRSEPEPVPIESDRRPATPEAANPTKKIKLSPVAASGPFQNAPEEHLGNDVLTPTGSGARTPVMVDADPVDLLRDDESDWVGGPWERTHTQLTDNKSLSEDDDWEDAVGDSDLLPHHTSRPLEIRNKTKLDTMEGTSSTFPLKDSNNFLANPLSDSGQSTTASQFRAMTLDAGAFDSVFNSPSPNQPKSVPPVATSATSLPFRIPTQGITKSPYAVDDGVPVVNYSRTQPAPTKPSVYSTKAKHRRNAPKGSSSSTTQQSEAEAADEFIAKYCPSVTSVPSTPPPLPPQSTPTTSPYTEREPTTSKNNNLIMPVTLLGEIGIHMNRRLHDIIQPGYITDRTCDFDIPTSTLNTLLCLSDEEYKYLPLWAHGLDDGSGGVFNDGMEVPDAPDVFEGGFRGGAMGIIPRVGSSVGSSAAGSEFEDLGSDAGASTVGKASRYATDGTATESVISMDE